MHPGTTASGPLSYLDIAPEQSAMGAQAFAPTTHGGAHPRLSTAPAATLIGLSQEEPTWTRSWLRSHASLLKLVEGSLSNDECPPTRKCWRNFYINNGLTEEQARQALTYRYQYLNNIYLDGFTPITAVDEALHFNPHTRQFEPD